jgi:YidC/Oxa1 family membrane protein insertase
MDQRNLIIAIVLSIAILLGFQYFVEHPKLQREQAARQAAQSEQSAQSNQPGSGTPPATGSVPIPGGSPVPGAPTGTATAPALSRAEALAGTPRIPIDTPRLHGSISLIGSRLDDLTLATYHETVDPSSPEIELLSPPRSPQPYIAESGWVPADPTVKVPGPDTEWTREGSGKLTPQTPVTLSWNNGSGLKFSRTIAVDDDYMFTVTQTVRNDGPAAVRLLPYSLISRTGTPHLAGFYILHEGLIGVLNGRLAEISYKTLKEEKAQEQTTTGGWLGITDKYWLTALVPPQDEGVKARFTHLDAGGGADKYQVDFLGQERTVAPGASAESTSRLFAGAKEVKLLDRYRDNAGIPRFDLAVDFGWFYFLTKPMFYAIDFFNMLIGNFGLAILSVTVIIKALFFPLANKSYKAMCKMKLLQPEMLKLREKFGEDKARLNQEMMALYKRVGANPLAGCLPIVIQIPVFFSLYKVLFVTIEMRHAPFYGWIRDLSAPDPSNLFELFGLFPWHPPHMLMIGLWPIIMGITMFLQQKLNPQPADPVQAKVFMLLPVIFTFMLASFPAGLVIYWAWNNTLSIAQQWIIMKRQGAA